MRLFSPTRKRAMSDRRWTPAATIAGPVVETFLALLVAPVLALVVALVPTPAIALALSGSSLAAQPDSKATQLCPAELPLTLQTCSLTLAPQEMKLVHLAIPAGRLRAFVVEQTAWTVEVRLPDVAAQEPGGSAIPFTNAAGLHSRIPILMGGSGRVSIQNPSKDKIASVKLTAEPAQPADAHSAQVQAAENDFARAESLRSQPAGDHADPIPYYDRAIQEWQALSAAKTIDNSQQLARALIWKADFLINSASDAAGAAPVLAQAGALLPSLEPIEAAHYWQVAAFIHVVKGEYPAALDAYTKSLDLCEKAGDVSYQAKILDNRARIEFMQGSSEKAMASEQQAADLAEKAGDTRRQAFVEEMLGSIESGLGDFEAAYQAYGQALQLMKRLPPNPRAEATVWTDLSDFYLTLGDLARTKDALDQALALYEKDKVPIGLVDTLNNYGDLYLAKNQPGMARGYLDRALTLSEKTGYERGSIAVMSGIGESYLIQKDAVHAREILERALARAKKAGQEDSTINIECHLGEVAQLQHDLKRAQEHYKNCLAGAVKAEDAYNQIRAEGSLANAGFAANELDDAESHCEHALGAIEAIRGHLRNQDLRTSFLASQHAYYDLAIQILMRLNIAHPDEDYAWQAFLIAERARARTLLDQITSVGQQSEGQDPNQAATGESDLRAVALQALLSQYEDVQRRLRRLETMSSSPSKNHGGPKPEETRAAIARLTLAEQQLHQETIRAQKANPDKANPDKANASKSETSTSSFPALTLESLQSSLPPAQTALIEYWTGEKASYAWSITRTGIRSFQLPPSATLDRECAAFRKGLLAIASPDTQLSAQQRAQAQSARELHWKQAGARLAVTLFPAGILPASTSTLLVVGDGPIGSIPLVALPGMSIIPAANGSLRKLTIVNEPSAAILALLESRSLSQHPERLAVFLSRSTPAGASGDSRSPHRLEATASRKGEDVPLPFAGDEAASIRTIFGVNAVHTFPPESISPRTLQNLDWNDFNIAHFAMHAKLNNKYAELTGLSVGVGLSVSGKSDLSSNPEKLLWYGDICHLHAHLDLVVLSGCDTALGEPVPGEGLRGLTQAFFAAGSQRVLGTLWEVDDQATSEWMRHFYESLKATRSPALALKRAQQSMAQDTVWHDPYYWAGFVLTGDWRPVS